VPEVGSEAGVTWWSWMLEDEHTPRNYLRWRGLTVALALAWGLVLLGGAAIYRVLT
jgi:hypothetical protein